MPAGRPRKPTALLQAAGTFRHDRHGQRVDALGVPSMPEWLASDALAVEVWQETLPLLISQGCAAEIDAASLAILCQAMSLSIRASDMAESAEWGTTERQRIRNEANAAQATVIKLSSRFGLTPADRAGIKSERQETQATDKSRFFASSAN